MSETGVLWGLVQQTAVHFDSQFVVNTLKDQYDEAEVRFGDPADA